MVEKKKEERAQTAVYKKPPTYANDAKRERKSLNDSWKREKEREESYLRKQFMREKAKEIFS